MLDYNEKVGNSFHQANYQAILACNTLSYTKEDVNLTKSLFLTGHDNEILNDLLQISEAADIRVLGRSFHKTAGLTDTFTYSEGGTVRAVTETWNGSDNVHYRTLVTQDSADLEWRNEVVDEAVLMQLKTLAESDVLQYFNITKDSIRINDGTNSHYIELNSDGIMISDGTNTNYMQLNVDGITFYTETGSNTMTFREGGVQINDHYLITHEFLDWLNTYKATLGIGNLGGPVPLFPPAQAEFSTKYITEDEYRTDLP